MQEVISTLKKLKVFNISKNFLVFCFQPLDLNVSLKLSERNASFHFTYIFVIKSLHLWLDKYVDGSLRCCILEADLE